MLRVPFPVVLAIAVGGAVLAMGPVVRGKVNTEPTIVSEVTLQPTEDCYIVLESVKLITYSDGHQVLRRKTHAGPGQAVKYRIEDNHDGTYTTFAITIDLEGSAPSNSSIGWNNIERSVARPAWSRHRSRASQPDRVLASDYIGKANQGTVEPALMLVAVTRAHLGWNVDQSDEVWWDFKTNECEPFTTYFQPVGEMGEWTHWFTGYCVNDMPFYQNSHQEVVWVAKGGYYNWDFWNDEIETTTKHWNQLTALNDGSVDCLFDAWRAGEAWGFLSHVDHCEAEAQ